MRAAEFYRGLAALLRAGILPREAVGHLERDRSIEAQEAAALRSAIDDGRPMSSALNGLLPAEEVALLEAGEAAGTLDRLLDRLAALRENERKLWRQFRGNIARPAMTAILAAFVMPIGLLGVSGKLTFGRWLMTMTVILGITGVIALVFRAMWRSPAGRIRLRAILDRIPGFGAAALHRRRARFCRGLEMAYDSGIPVAQALSYAGQGLDDRASAASVAVVEEGRSITNAVATMGLLSAGQIGRLSSSEQAGDLATALRAIAEDEAEQSELSLKRGAQYAEVLLYVIVGAMVFWYALTVIGSAYSGF